ncbi:hypothetical protein HK100_002066 [Physocladia obscura]|uniref:G protein-coupled receptor n=1 Tax=Physocladia obscura TaxID=109957 RepID=A0AAD5SWU8_9FUNG|nr:hypothetical protein HK100_002066 [Physocladia obscura]
MDSGVAIAYSLLVIYAIGAMFNGCILIITIARPELRQSKVNKITAILLFTILLWCLGRVIIQTLLLLDAITLNNRAVAAFSNIVVVCTFSLNLDLAIERLKNLWQPTTDSFRPSTQPQQLIWLVLVPGVSYFGTVVLMIFLYTATYRHSSKELDSLTSLVPFFVANRYHDIDDETVESLRQKLERQILFKCIGLSSSLIISYVPLLIYGAIITLQPGTDSNGTYFDVVVMIMSLDVLFTPALVLYFRQDMREAIIP